MRRRFKRAVARWWANAHGYFWLPCPRCGEMFGGHEYHKTAPPYAGDKLVCKPCGSELRSMSGRARASDEINRLLLKMYGKGKP